MSNRNYKDRFLQASESNLVLIDGYGIGLAADGYACNLPIGFTVSKVETGVYRLALDRQYGALKSVAVLPIKDTALITTVGSATELVNCDLIEVRFFNTSGTATDPVNIFWNIVVKQSKLPVGW